MDHQTSLNSVTQQYHPYTQPAIMSTTSTQLPPPPPNTTQRPAHTNTFVHKLYK